MKKVNLAVVGATGAVGRQMLKCLEERNFEFASLKLMAAPDDAGQTLEVNGKSYTVEAFSDDFFKGVDIALFSAGGDASLELAPKAVAHGAVVIDNSSAFRMDPNVPLVVPEVNPDDAFKHKGIIANPNCSTIQMVVAMKPLHDYGTIKRVVVSTYQAVSGTGMKAIKELEGQARQFINGEKPEVNVYPHQIAFNMLPHIDVFLDNGYTKEEMKMVNETKKIFGDDSILVCPTAVRVPVFNSHSESVNIETEKKITASLAKELLAKGKGIIVCDDPANNTYPMPIEVTGNDEVYVGRIREDLTIENGINFWVVADNLRKGAATNAVQIAELLVK